jgi:hypothetical protein
MIKGGVIREDELSHITFNKVTEQYEADQYHLILINSLFSQQHKRQGVYFQ